MAFSATITSNVAVVVFAFVSSVLSLNFTVHPSDTTTIRGSTATFMCAVPSDFQHFLFWVKNDNLTDGLISKNTNITENFNAERFYVSFVNGTSDISYTLSIFNVTDEDAGNYSCALSKPKPERPNNSKLISSLEATLTVVGEPNLQCVTSPRTADVGDIVTFICSFNKSLAVTIPLTWNMVHPRNGGVSMTFGSTRRVERKQNHTVTWKIRDIDNFEDFGCYVGDTLGCKVMPMQLPPSPSVLQGWGEHILGGYVNFSCEPQINHPTITHYMWKIISNDSTDINEVNSTYGRFEMMNEGKTLLMKNLTASDQDSEISCSATNALGITAESASVTLTLESPDSLIYIIIIGSLAGVVLVLVLLLVVLLCFLKRKCNRQNSKLSAGQDKQVYDEIKLSTIAKEQGRNVEENGATYRRQNSEPKYATPSNTPYLGTPPTEQRSKTLHEVRYENTAKCASNDDGNDTEYVDMKSKAATFPVV